MKRCIKAFIALVILGWCMSSSAAKLPSGWRYEQQLTTTAPGLVKLSLPADTLNGARPGLEDLRIYDDAGNEVPYTIFHAEAPARVTRVPKSFRVSLGFDSTMLEVETGTTDRLEGVTLESPAADFIKAVKVEGADNGRDWRDLGQGRAIFRQANGASQLRVDFPMQTLKRLRLTVDDRRSRPIPFTGVRLHATASATAANLPIAAAIEERHENPGETRLVLDLGAANLDIAAVEFETPEPLFFRQVTVAVQKVADQVIREDIIAQDTIYRAVVEGHPRTESLRVRVDHAVGAKQLLLLLKNQDSPALSLPKIKATRHPVFLIFLARDTGVYHLLTGNNTCPLPRYDLNIPGINLATTDTSDIAVSAPRPNPAYAAAEVLPGVQPEGAGLDVSAWRFRKAVTTRSDGLQEVELDLDVLSRAAADYSDLRLVRSGKQVPYITEQTSIRRSINPEVTLKTDVRDPRESCWVIQVPRRRLPLESMHCTVQTELFQRNLRLTEDPAKELGQTGFRQLASAMWRRTPGETTKEFTLILDARPEGDELTLRTENGDNPPITISNVRFFYSAVRLVFKAKANQEIYLYYGNSEAIRPAYDLGLIADRLLVAEKRPAELGNEEQLKRNRWDTGALRSGGIFFWVVLGMVVTVLLLIISRLLPKTAHRTRERETVEHR